MLGRTKARGGESYTCLNECDLIDREGERRRGERREIREKDIERREQRIELREQEEKDFNC